MEPESWSGSGALRLALASIQDVLEVQHCPLLSRSQDGQAVAEAETGRGRLLAWHSVVCMAHCL